MFPFFQPEWAVGDWSNCTAVGAAAAAEELEVEDDEGSSAAGNGSCPGIMLRNVFCQQMIGLDKVSVVDEELCSGEKPVAQKLCSDVEEEGPEDSEPKVRFLLIYTLDNFWLVNDRAYKKPGHGSGLLNFFFNGEKSWDSNSYCKIQFLTKIRAKYFSLKKFSSDM